MKLAFILMIFSLIFTGFMMPYPNNDYHISRGEELVNCILEEVAIIIKNKYKLSPIGAGAAMPGGPIQKLSLCFDVRGILSKDKLRELLIHSANDLLEKVIENEEIQQYLKYKPFTIMNIEIIIHNHDSKGRSVQDPEISVARISRGKLIFRTKDPDDEFKYKNEFEETYEEALEILKNQK